MAETSLNTTTKPSLMSDAAQQTQTQPTPHRPTRLADLYKPSSKTNNGKMEPSQLSPARQTLMQPQPQHPSTTQAALNTTPGPTMKAQDQYSIEMPPQPPTLPLAPPLPPKKLAPKKPSSFYLSG